MTEKRHLPIHSFSSFVCHRAALVLSFLAYSAGLSPVAGDTCDGVAGVLRQREVAIICPLTADVYQTEHSIIIKHFNTADEAETVLGCDWLLNQDRFNCLRSRAGAELIRIMPDRVLASLPKDKLKNGPYRCQLVPPNRDYPFTDCTICDPDIPTTSGATTTTTLRTSIPAKQTTTTPDTHANDKCLRNVTINMAFTIVAVVLQVVIVLGWTVRSGLVSKTLHRLRSWWREVTGHCRPGCVEDPDEDPTQHEKNRPGRGEPDSEASGVDEAKSSDALL